ncbi:MATE family efflux transporter [Streptomyces hainanensis]|uniref:Probable multidrug resistance protein NorM n=1 Tax=Streptomyces hainanensis TaxID=402648 RepID=A0A4R4T7H7_9ACTN|nr:MATE family efflux transporter [Streptomyces hainanensis]
MLADGRSLATLAVPLALTQLAQVALSTTDTVMLGMLGAGELAAGGLALVVFNQVRTMGVGLITAAGNQIAAAVASAEGRENDDRGAAEVRRIVRASLALATAAGLGGAGLMLLIGQLLGHLGQDVEVVADTRRMLITLAPGLVPALWFQTVRQFTVGMRRPQALLRITLASIAVNAALNVLLIHGPGPMPALGLAGVGLATTLVHLLTAAALFGSARRDPELAPLLALDLLRADRSTLRRLCGLGVPVAVTYGSEAGFFSVTALIAGSFGSSALAAHTAVNQLVYIVFQIAVGLSHASSIHVSREIALGRPHGAARVRDAALATAALVTGLVAAAYVAAPTLVLLPFLDTGAGEAGGEEAFAIARDLLLVAAVLQLFDCCQNIGIGLLRGLDDTRSGLRFTLVGYWLIGLPTVFLLAYGTALGLTGIWLGLLVGLAVTATLLLNRYRLGLRDRTDRLDATPETA